MRHLAQLIIVILILIQALSSCKQSHESGTYLGNAIVAAPEDPVKLLFPGNWADPTIAKVGDVYYLTSNNDHYAPSVLVFQSMDLKHWEPLTYASPLTRQGPATDMVAVGKRLFIYGGGGMDSWVMYADPPYMEWSDRINMEPLAPHPIDAGHIMDDTGNRYLYTAQGNMLQLTSDGLKAETVPEKVYDGWKLPDEIAIECFCLESPKLFIKDGWYYMVSAQGGTAGPTTAHMAVVARAQSPAGPWENSPLNPLIWTRDESELWWSKGHATLVEDPQENWFAIYHGYRHGHRSWGRATLISPVEWNMDGWPVLASRWPAGWDAPPTINLPIADEFDGDDLGMQWQAYERIDTSRYNLRGGVLEIIALEEDPGLSNPLTVNPRHLAYEVETEMTLEGDGYGGLILFYSPVAYIALGLTSEGSVLKRTQKSREMEGKKLSGDIIPYTDKSIRLKIKNDRQDASFYYAAPNGDWVKLERSDDISGFQHNIFGGFSSVRPGFFATGSGRARFEYFRYHPLPQQK